MVSPSLIYGVELVSGQLKFKVRPAHTAYQQYWHHRRKPLNCLMPLLFVSLSILFNFPNPLLCPPTGFILRIASYQLSSCCCAFVHVLLDICKYIRYLLFGTLRGHRNEDMPL